MTDPKEAGWDAAPRERPPRPSRHRPDAGRPTHAGGPGRGPHGGENPMATARLRVFPRPEDDVYEEDHAPSVPVRLADLYPLLAQAYRDNFVWLRDFESDELLVSRDLHEAIRAFSDCRPSA